MGSTGFDASRLRRGEVIAAVSGVLLIVFMVSMNWYGLKTPLGWTAATLGVPTSFTGWNALSHLRWLIIITVLAAVALAYFQGARRAPALPSSLSVIVTTLAFITAIVLAYRVLLDVPGSGEVNSKPGAYLGLVSAVAMFYGGYASLRQEGITPRDAPAEIETVELQGTPLGTETLGTAGGT